MRRIPTDIQGLRPMPGPSYLLVSLPFRLQQIPFESETQLGLHLLQEVFLARSNPPSPPTSLPQAALWLSLLCPSYSVTVYIPG